VTQIPKTKNLFLFISHIFLTNPATKQLKTYHGQEKEGKVTGIATADHEDPRGGGDVLANERA
jgi:hypothetical protein